MRPDASFKEIVQTLLERGVTGAPVVDDNRRMLGIVTQADPRLTPEDNAVTASVEDGLVTLEGTVPYPPDVTVLDAMVWRIPGVVGVRNQVVARKR